jgi:hypothetical protein
MHRQSEACEQQHTMLVAVAGCSFRRDGTILLIAQDTFEHALYMFLVRCVPCCLPSSATLTHVSAAPRPVISLLLQQHVHDQQPLLGIFVVSTRGVIAICSASWIPAAGAGTCNYLVCAGHATCKVAESDWTATDSPGEALQFTCGQIHGRAWTALSIEPKLHRTVTVGASRAPAVRRSHCDRAAV